MRRKNRRRKRRKKKCRRQCGSLHVVWFQAARAGPSGEGRLEGRLTAGRRSCDGQLTVGVHSSEKGYSTDLCEGFRLRPLVLLINEGFRCSEYGAVVE